MTALTDLVGLIGLEPVQGVPILVGVDRDSAGSEFDGGPEGSDRDLATVCYQDLAKHHTSLWVRGPA